MTCDQRESLIPLYAAGGLDPAERDELRAHLAAGCPRCAGALAEYEATLAQLPLALPPQAPTADAKSRLMQRIRSTSRQPAKPDIAGSIRPRATSAIFPRLAIAALLAAAVGGVSTYLAMAARQRQLQAQLTDQAQSLTQVNADLNVARQMLRIIRDPATRLVQLAGTDAQPKASLRIFWDNSSNTWVVTASNLKPVQKGHGYEIWYIEQGQGKSPVPVKALVPDSAGDAVATIDLPKNLAPLALAAITEEDITKEVKAPTTPIIAKGELLR